MTEVFGQTIQLFLVDGTPNGLIIASIHGWTGSVLVANQSTFDRLLARPEVLRTGIYILYGPDTDDPLKSRAYIGEADNVAERIDRSAEERGFWQTAIVITTSDEALTKGDVRYLEARLIEITRNAGRVILDNGQEPAPERRRLPEAGRANMESFLASLKVILPVVGLDLLKPQPGITKAAALLDPSADGGTRFEIRHTSGVKAYAVEEEGEFVVLKDSQALREAGYGGSQSYANLKTDLISQGVLCPSEDAGIYVFARAHVFPSPSAASAVVLDRNSNGRREWKVVGSKLTYHEWQEERARAMQERSMGTGA